MDSCLPISYVSKTRVSCMELPTYVLVMVKVAK